MTTVVLGWDGLDHELVTEWGLADAFGDHHREIETFDNPVLGKPHTYEVWPSIVTGVGPDAHGIRAATADAGADWESDWLTLAARLSSGVVPQRVRTVVGRVLRERGATLDFRDANYYDERGLETVFDDRRALALAVPNYRTAADDDLGVVFDRGAQLGEYLHVEPGGDGGTRHRPKVPLATLEQRLAAEACKKLGAVDAAVQREYDLVFVWLGFLDTIGHLAPTVSEPGWQRRWYDVAAHWTAGVRGLLTDADALVCLSDHGLRGGTHTHAAYFGATDERVVRDVESVLDVAAALDAVTPTTGDGAEPPVSEAYRYEGDAGDEAAASVRGRLEDLGYM